MEPRPRPRPAASRAARRPPVAATVRWDRVGRVLLLGVLLVVVGLYAGPAKSYVDTWRESGERRAEVRRLTQERDRLLERRRQLARPATLEHEARRLGMVRPGERGYVIDGLPE